ncbi:flagellar brake protein [Alkalicoccus chagannorensis]|uniref:flagellar brake protein n=1 Tax=Alkalicoccus chagannorensis TaxID=427072 RepID=UPI00054FF944|nr:flagellar brake domain-containing protein [Alkalicoccus chagannorensis]
MIKVGNMIHLEAEDEESGVEKLRSKILDYDKDRIYIDYPISEKTDKQRFFLDGTQFNVSFIGKDEAVYSFRTEVTGRARDRVPMLVLKDPGKDNYTRIQRREFVRLDTSLDAAFYSPDDLFEPFTTTTIDISGGGMAARLPETLTIKKGELVDIWSAVPFRNGDIEYLRLKAETVRVVPGTGWSTGSFKFIGIDESMRQKIVRYIFEKQQEYKERGL